MTLYEVDEAANRIREEVDPDANIIFGTSFDEALEGFIRVSVVATGLNQDEKKATGVSSVSAPSLKIKIPTETEAKIEKSGGMEAALKTENISDFTQATEKKKFLDEAKADDFNFDDLEIPAFLRRQAN